MSVTAPIINTRQPLVIGQITARTSVTIRRTDNSVVTYDKITYKIPRQIYTFPDGKQLYIPETLVIGYPWEVSAYESWLLSRVPLLPSDAANQKALYDRNWEQRVRFSLDYNFDSAQGAAEAAGINHINTDGSDKAVGWTGFLPNNPMPDEAPGYVGPTQYESDISLDGRRLFPDTSGYLLDPKFDPYSTFLGDTFSGYIGHETDHGANGTHKVKLIQLPNGQRKFVDITDYENPADIAADPVYKHQILNYYALGFGFYRPIDNKYYKPDGLGNLLAYDVVSVDPATHAVNLSSNPPVVLSNGEPLYLQYYSETWAARIKANRIANGTSGTGTESPADILTESPGGTIVENIESGHTRTTQILGGDTIIIDAYDQDHDGVYERYVTRTLTGSYEFDLTRVLTGFTGDAGVTPNYTVVADDVLFHGINIGSVGSILGSSLGNVLGEDQFSKIAASTLLSVMGENIAETLGYVFGRNYSLIQGISAAFIDFGPNLEGAVIGSISSYLSGELIHTLGLEGTVAGDIGNSVVSSALTQLITNIAAGVPNPFEGITIDLPYIVATYIGSRIADQIWQPTSVGGQLGSAIGEGVGGLDAAAILSITGPTPVGITLAILAIIVDKLVGGYIGELINGTPKSYATATWSEDKNAFIASNIHAKNGASESVAAGLAQSVSDALNAVVVLAGSKVIEADGIHAGEYGMRGDKFVYWKTSPLISSSDPNSIIRYGTYIALTDLSQRMAGGDVYVKRALSANLEQVANQTSSGGALTSVSAFNLESLLGDLTVAGDYSTYFDFSDQINALIASDPTSVFAAGWLVTLARAHELGLDRRASSDWIGGWSAFLDERWNGSVDGNGFLPSEVAFQFDFQSLERQTLFLGPSLDVVGWARDNIDVQAKSFIRGTDSDDTVTIVGSILQSEGLTVDGNLLSEDMFTINVAATVEAGAGNDTIRLGDLGNDAFGGDGNDVLVGGKLDDWLLGEDGNDVLFAGGIADPSFASGDSIGEATALGTDGGSGNLLDGGDGDDRLYGGSGSDWLKGGAGVDRLLGGAGGDVLAGGAGDDRGSGNTAAIMGGAGSDQYIFGYGDGQDVVLDEDGSVAASAADITSRIASINAQTSTNPDGRGWAGGGDYLVDGSVVGGEDAISFGAGITMADIILRRSGTSGSPGNDLIIQLTAKNTAGLDVPTGDELTIKNWFVTANRVEWLRFTDGDEFRIGDIVTFIVGTGASDVILGTTGADFIYAGGGNDIVHALQGRDFVTGGTGNDFVTGDSDEDLVIGGVGNDDAVGGGGNDTVSGDAGNDIVYGGDGSDILSGGKGNDTVVGGAGDDIIEFKRGDGQDTLIDEYVDNWELVGTDSGGTTTFANGYNIDADGHITKGGVTYFDGTTWTGSFKYDDATGKTYRWLGPVSGATAVNAGTDVLEFDIGIDIQDLQFRQSGNDLRIAVTDENSSAAFDAVTDGLTIKDWFGTAGHSIETMVFAAVGKISLTSSANALSGYSNLVGGTSGADTLTGTSSGDWMTGNEGDDTISGGAGSDLLAGGAGDDHLLGGDSTDVLYGGAGNDILDGGLIGPNALDFTNRLFGGDGFDIASYQSYPGGYGLEGAGPFGVTVYLADTTRDTSLTGDWVTNVRGWSLDGFNSIEGLEGSNYGDRLYGNAADDTLRGMGGADMLQGGAGDDDYEFNRGDGADTIKDAVQVVQQINYYDVGDINSTTPYYYVWTTVGFVDAIEGQRFRYELNIYDRATSQVVYSGWEEYSTNHRNVGPPPGVFTPTTVYPLESGGTWSSDADFVSSQVFGPGGGRLWPGSAMRVGSTSGNAGSDTLRMGTGISLSDLTFSKSGNDLVIDAGGGDTVTLKDQYNTDGSINTDRAIETLVLADGLAVDLTHLVLPGGSAASGSVDDFMVGNSSANTLAGNDGNDTLSGGAGADSLSGGAGDDVLEGGAGADTLDGGIDSILPGLKPVQGQRYGDTVRYNTSSAGVTINLATSSASGGDAQGDTIVSSGGVSSIENVIGSDGYADALTGDSRANRLAGLGGDDTIHGGAGMDVLGGGDGNDLLYGDDGEDNIDAGAGDDQAWGGADKDLIVGGAGNDILRGEDGDDSLQGGDGNDTLYGGAGVDHLLGGAGNDDLQGGDGDDVLAGEAGNDTLTGGDGNDLYVFDANGDTDTIVDALGVNGIAILDVTSDQIWLSQSGNDLKIGVIGGSTRITITGYFTSGGAAHFNRIDLMGGTLFLAHATDLIQTMTAVSVTPPAAMSEQMVEIISPFWHAGGKASPVAQNQNVHTLFNAALPGAVGASDDDDNITGYTVESGPTSGTLALNATTGLWTYTPTATAAGTDSFQVRVTDADGHFVIQTVSVDLTAPPAAPTVSQSATIRNESATATTLTTVATLTSSQTGGTPTWTLDDPWGWFQVSGNTLSLKAGLTLDYETLAAGAESGYWTLSDSDSDGLMEVAYTIHVHSNLAGVSSQDAAITYRLENVNEAPSISPQTFTANENAGANLVVGTVTSTDVDTGAWADPRYAITGGTDASAFTINATTGQLTLVNPANYEAKSSYSLTVTVTDHGGTGGLSASATITVNVTNLNETPTISAQTWTLAENNAAGATVHAITASDVDGSGSFGTLTYSITGGADASAFSINTTTGVLSISSTSNYEAKSSYSVIVRVTDGGGLWAEGAVTVNITDVNEGPTVAPQTFNLAENAGANAVVGTVQSTDPDGGTFGARTYSLSGADAAAFTINTATGALTKNTSADYETKSSYSVTVRATDGGGLWSEGAVTVNITDVNEAPTISPQTLSVNENTAANFALSPALTSSDPDVGTYANPRYSISGTDAAAFTINATTGVLTLVNPANYEAKSSYSLTVTVQDTAGSGLSASAAVTVNVNDVNEPVVVTSGQAFTVADGASVGTSVGVVAWSDPDTATVNRSPYFSLSGADAAAFSINQTTGQITVGSALTPGKTSYTFTVTAVDQSGTGNSSSQSVTVSLTDVNHAPVVNAQSFSVNENVATGTSVGTVAWSDSDTLSGNRDPRFAISGADASAFTIDALTGELKVNGALNYEAKSTYSFTVTVTDRAGTGLATSQTLTVNVGNLNETPSLSAGSYTFSLAENAGANASVGSVSATDPDAGANGTLSYSLTGTDAAAFTINATTGAITKNTSADYDTKTSYSFNVVVADNSGSGLSASSPVTVNITDVNEAPVVGAQAFTVNENVSTGTAVGAATASDPDVNSANRNLRYALSGTGASNFSIDASTGAITTAGALNYESTSVYNLTLTVTDQGGSGLSSTAALTINVGNLSEAGVDSAPTYSQSASIRNESATATTLTTVATLTSTQTGTATYSISEDPLSWFQISGNTLSLKAGLTLNFETLAASTPAAWWSLTDSDSDGNMEFTYTVKVRSTVGGVNSFETAIQYRVEDVNEAPSIPTQSFTIAEHVAAGSTVGTITWTDIDTQANNQSPYFWLTGTDAAAFTVNSSTGVISIVGSPDYATKTSYSVTLNIKDRNNTGLSASRVVNIAVTDVNEAPSIAAGQVFTVDENSATGATVGTVSWSDPDVITANRNPRFAISGTDASKFRIGSTTGVITTFGGGLDYETKSSYTLTVTITDSGGTGLSYNQTITINLNDLADSPDSAPTYSQSVTGQGEGATTSTTIATLTATQTGGTATFAEYSDPLDWFTVSGANLTLRSGLTLDFETLAASTPAAYWALTDVDADGLMEFSYGVKVISTVNSVTSQPSAYVWYRVEDVNEAPVVSAQTFSVAENATTGTVVGTVAWSDPDTQSSTRDPRFAISGADAAAFSINATTGQITLASGVNYEAKSSYSFTVTVTDRAGAGIATSQTITVNLTDVNEAPAISAQTFSVAENGGANAAVGTIAWSDPDTASGFRNPRFSLSGTDAAAFTIDAVTGALTMNASADYEAKASYSLTVTVTDSGGTGLSASAAVTVNVSDVNEAPAASAQSFAINENVSLGTVVGTVTATDPDTATANRNLRYALSGTGVAAFTINATTGQITTAGALDYETTAAYNLTLTITDQGGTGLSTTGAITININNLSETGVDSAPTFSQSASIRNESATATTALTIGTITTTQTGGTPTYSIADDPLGWFTLSGNTLSLAAGLVLDFETLAALAGNGYVTLTDVDSDGVMEAAYTAKVRTTVNGVDSQTLGVTYRVEDVNEAPTIPTQTFYVDEYSASGAVVGTISATDPDSQSYNRDLRYSLSGADAAAFTIDAVTGQITVAGSLNYATKNSYTVNVKAQDKAGTGLSYTKSIIIHVNDVNEAPTIASGQVFTVDENVASGTVVGTLAWSDPDVVNANRNPRFSLSGADAAKFRIGSTTGIISTNGTGLDYETKSSYTFNVTITDSGGTGLSYTQSVTVNLNDVAEGAPPIVLDLDGDGVELVAPAASSARFDLDGDGVADQAGWAGADDGFLALDRDGDGVIGGLAEISFVGDKTGATSDLEGLAAFDTDGDGWLDAGDADYARFRVWQDANQDGVSQASELKTLAEAGITGISLAGVATGAPDAGGLDNVVQATSVYRQADGSTGQVADVRLGHEAMMQAQVLASDMSAKATEGPVSGPATWAPHRPLGSGGYWGDWQSLATIDSEDVALQSGAGLVDAAPAGVSPLAPKATAALVQAAKASGDTPAGVSPLDPKAASGNGGHGGPLGLNLDVDTGDASPGAVSRVAKNRSPAQQIRDAVAPVDPVTPVNGGEDSPSLPWRGMPATAYQLGARPGAGLGQGIGQASWQGFGEVDYDSLAMAGSAASALTSGITLAETSRFKMIQAMASFAPEASADTDARNDKLHDRKAMELLTALPQQKAFG